MGAAAREYVLENLTWEENARRNEEIYQRAIEQF
jgi:glycosyltransferase involved in cell wall biosynthesis